MQYSLETSSEEDDDFLIPERYSEADIRGGLQSGEFRLAALQELKEVVDRCFKNHTSKKLQARIVDDLMLAAQLTDSRSAVTEAVTALVESAKRVLPHQKRSQLIAEHRRAALAHHRALRKAQQNDDSSGDRGGGGSGSGGGSDGGSDVQPLGATISEVPPEVLLQVLLACDDPVSLARAACSCRAWRQLAEDETLWMPWMQQLYPAGGRAGRQRRPRAAGGGGRGGRMASAGRAEGGDGVGGGSARVGAPAAAHVRFGEMAAERPRALLPWRACRVLQQGRLRWQLPGTMLPPPGGKPARRRVARCGPQQRFTTPLLLLPGQVVVWMMGGDVRCNDDSSDDASGGSSGSSSEGEESHCGVLRLWCRHAAM